MENDPLKIKVATEPATMRTKRGASQGPPWVPIVSGLVALLILGGGAAIYFRGDQQTLPESPEAVQSKPSQDQAAASTESESLVAELPAPKEDDGKSLWVSPTMGDPLELGYVLPGTQLILHLCVADLLSHSEGQKVLAALGPWGQQMVNQVQDATGLQLSEMESLLLGIRLTSTGGLDYSLKIQTSDEWSQQKMVDRGLKLDGSNAEKIKYQSPNGRFCFLTSHPESGSLVISATAETMPEILTEGNQPPLFPREMQRVLQQTDSTRTATLVFAGKFLQISGEKFLTGTSEPLREALIDFLGDEATATALSAHWDENFFLELRSTVALNERPHRFAAVLEKRIAAASDRVENTILAEPPHPYSRKVLARFPAMLRKLDNYTRAAEDQNTSLLRTYLPLTAGHNLLLATELLLNSPTGGSALSSSIASSSTKDPQTLADRLQKTTSLVFPKETLQKSLEILSEDLGVPIEIAGRDLQLEGITKNQSFALELRQQPGAEILLAILLRANPDRTASGPNDVKQKLVYIVRDSTENQPGAIVVTTRAAADRRGDKLPDVFVAAGR